MLYRLSVRGKTERFVCYPLHRDIALRIYNSYPENQLDAYSSDLAYSHFRLPADTVTAATTHQKDFMEYLRHMVELTAFVASNPKAAWTLSPDPDIHLSNGRHPL